MRGRKRALAQTNPRPVKAAVRVNGVVEDGAAEDYTVVAVTAKAVMVNAVLAPRETGKAIMTESCPKPSKRIDIFWLPTSTLGITPLSPLKSMSEA